MRGISWHLPASTVKAVIRRLQHINHGIMFPTDPITRPAVSIAKVQRPSVDESCHDEQALSHASVPSPYLLPISIHELQKPPARRHPPGDTALEH